jgi:hypothetical protein
VVGALDYNPKHFGNTILKDLRAPGYGKFNLISDVAVLLRSD